MITYIIAIQDLQRTPQSLVIPTDHFRNILFCIVLWNYIFSVILDLKQFVMGTIKEIKIKFLMWRSKYTRNNIINCLNRQKFEESVSLCYRLVPYTLWQPSPMHMPEIIKPESLLTSLVSTPLFSRGH